MVEDPSSNIKKCSVAAIESVLTLPHGFDADAACEASQSSFFLQYLIDYLKSAGRPDSILLMSFTDSCCGFSLLSIPGGEHIRICIQLWMQRSCSDQPSTNSAIKNLGR